MDYQEREVSQVIEDQMDNLVLVERAGQPANLVTKVNRVLLDKMDYLELQVSQELLEPRA